MKVKIGELTSIKTGKLDANASSPNGEYPFFTCSREPLRISTYSYDCECVLVAGNGDLNVKYYNGKFDAYQRTYIIEDNSSGRLYMRYLYFFMMGYIDELRKQAIGGVIKYIKLGNLTEALIELPTIEEQKRIVEILQNVQSIIEKEKRQNECFDELIKARFVEMFGNKGENPNGYEEDTLGNLYKFQYGKGNNIPEDKGEYPCYGSNGIVGHHTEYNNEDSPIIGHIGAYAGIVNWGAGKHYVTYNGVMCKLKTDRVNPTYGFHLLQQQDFNRVATKGGGQPFVSYGDLEAPIVVVPPIEVQEAYATFADKVDKSKVVKYKKLRGGFQNGN